MIGYVLCMGAALADKRVALLIGNSHYTAVGALNNPGNDVGAMASALKGAGFTIVHANIDLSREAMVKALRSFEDEATVADIAVIYYSGHGMEMNGINYLVPVDARLASDRDVEDETITLDRALRAIDGARQLKLVILDACRNNPFLPKMTHTAATRAVERGLARVEPSTVNTLIAFSAKAGTVAQDGDGANSPFTASLIKHLVEPGVDIRLALGEVRDDVMASTGNQQEPFVNGSLGGRTIALAEGQPNARPPSIPDAVSSQNAAPTLPRQITTKGFNGRDYVEGVFVRDGTTLWEERNSQWGKAAFHFRALQQSSAEIILYDPSRKMLLRFDLVNKTSAWRLEKSSEWVPLYDIVSMK
ncbi:caspase family protein [Labrys monachus]|uniref:Caspase family p20 domain-containing protein n=1 Tax=Labrys monachus TaxID=217067 RepID=A0ABU0F7B8_9HYPH|nr:caspase family protein [Labrys monachus]MDQ0390506.1 hypothetical protein [Labrys monachus]